MSATPPVFETTVREGVLVLARPDTDWLATGWGGGRRRADAVYSVTVPEGWDRRDLGSYVAGRLRTAGFEADAAAIERDRSARTADGGPDRTGATAPPRDGTPPILLTGVDTAHARGARCGPVVAVATAGVSNPAALPMDPGGDALSAATATAVDDADGGDGDPDAGETPDCAGTVNLVVATTRALAPGALANLLPVAAEAKAATLLAATGVPGTTTDAVVVGCDPAGERAAYSGSATPVGAATRACVREAVGASLDSRYGSTDATVPTSVADADHGVTTSVRAAVFEP